MDPETSVAKLNFIGTKYEKRLYKLGIESVRDLVYHFPFRYDDYSAITKIASCRFDETVCVRGTVQAIQNVYTRSRKQLTKAIVYDTSGPVTVVWFNQPFLSRTLKAGMDVQLAGKVDLFNNEKALISPEYEIIKDKEPIHTGRIVPVYPETYGISSKWLRSRISPILKPVVSQIDDFLPPHIREKHALLSITEALVQIHFPDNFEVAKRARERLAFDELFLLQLTNLERKKEWKKAKLKDPFVVEQEDVLRFTASLPFELTNAQKRCLKEIFADLAKNAPMNRLLEGDVGSGKTVIAAASILLAYKNGYQSAFMAPTEILAQQHFHTLTQLLKPFGLQIVLATGSKKPKDVPAKPDLIVGTHALIAQKISFTNLGFVVIDEQHRFGVEQRALLSQKGITPHVLTMTATPIPRTLALTLYGDLDISILDETPKGRIKVKTFVVPPHKRADAYIWIEKQIKESDYRNQAFIICPFVEESESMKTVKAATAEYEQLKNVIFPNLTLGLLHGRMKSKEKDEVLGKFRSRDIHILVATPVVEVGIDIPNATIMIVEGAERFGLSQLHQLRGRVGRGSEQSYCFLFSESQSSKTTQRLKAMENENSGIKLAEIDLDMRGPGEVFGLKQHGIPNLKVASLLDAQLIKQTHDSAEEIVASDPELSKSPALSAKLKEAQKKLIEPN